MDSADGRPLLGKRILVVEDDYMIAYDMVDALRAAGAVPVGPVGRMGDTLKLLRTEAALDGAVLDVDLHGTPSYPIADALIANGVPFVFATGFSAEALDPAYRHHPRLEKPISERALAAILLAQSTV